MIIYAALLMSLSPIMLVIELCQNKGHKALSTLIAIFIQLPIYGRVFGWW